MKITEEDVKGFIEFIQEAETFRPIVTMTIDAVISYGPELNKLIGACADGLVDLKLRMIERFEKGGLTKEQAMVMTTAVLKNIEEAGRKMASVSKK